MTQSTPKAAHRKEPLPTRNKVGAGKLDSRRSAGHSLFKVQGVQLLMPFPPYQSQVQVMTTLLQAVQRGENALIQSGTGTGKTLALLVASLGWLLQHGDKKTKIVYLSRTHSQLKQVAAELGRSAYAPKVMFYGGREQLCCNDALRAASGSLLDIKCAQARRKQSCKFGKGDLPRQIPPLEDIQSLQQLGKSEGFCPYYFARGRVNQAQLVLMPFNYLLDQQVLQSCELKLADAVLIFDEAHNLDNFAADGYSLKLSENNISAAERQLRNVQHSIQKTLHKKASTVARETVDEARGLIKGLGAGLLRSKGFIGPVEESRETIKRVSKVQLEGLLGQSFEGLSSDNIQQAQKQLQQIIDYGRRVSLDIANLSQVRRFIKKLLQIESEDKAAFYRLGVLQEEGEKSYSVFCLSAGEAFGKLGSARSIILCSGTLEPFEEWEKQLRIEFRHKIACASYITEKHIMAGCLSSFMPGQSFEWSYGKQSNDMLAVLLKDLAATVSHGVLVCFSTYRMLDQFKNCMRKKQLSSFGNKPVFFQSKNQTESNRSFIQYSRKAKEKSGAIIMGVLRGKLSQGIDFEGDLCRCLVVVGIPFAPVGCPRVQQKKIFLKGEGRDPQRWYQDQAMKAVSQAIGRAVRNQHDYGAVVLADCRYSRAELQSKLPAYIRDKLVKFDSLLDLKFQLTGFFSSRLPEQQIQTAQEFSQKKVSAADYNEEYSQKVIQTSNNKKAEDLVEKYKEAAPQPVKPSPKKVKIMREPSKATARALILAGLRAKF